MINSDINNKAFVPVKNHPVDNSQPLCEAEFNHLLALERKRSERSHKPLLLLLIDVTCLSGETNYHYDSIRLFRELSVMKREIDLCGWYRQGDIMAVLFAEITPEAIARAKDVISEKLREHLSALFLPDVVCRITFTFHQFPEIYTGGEMLESESAPFYPELITALSNQKWAQQIKRGMDIIGSLAALVLFSPFFLVIPILIKLTSPGPVLFRQERLGQFGKKFNFLKFRSMHINNNDSIHRKFIKDFIADNVAADSSIKEPGVYKICKDPRLTPIGAFLRKSSLDELPQFINVLKGDMSLVGPRPPIPYEVVDYDLWHRRRVLAEKPGITGLWQVTGRSLTSFDGMVRLDLRYNRTRSFWLDIKLLLATPKAVIRGKGAY